MTPSTFAWSQSMGKKRDQRIYTKYVWGWTDRAISEEEGCHEATVWRAIKRAEKAGVKPSRSADHFPDRGQRRRNWFCYEDLEHARWLIDRGEDLSIIKKRIYLDGDDWRDFRAQLPHAEPVHHDHVERSWRPRGDHPLPYALPHHVVEEIREAEGSGSTREVGDRFGVAHTTVWRIWAGERHGG